MYWLLLSAEKIKCLGVDKCFGFTFLAWIGGCGFYLWVPGVVSAADGVRDVAKRSAAIYEKAEETESELRKVGWIIKKATMCSWCVLYESILVVKLQLNKCHQGVSLDPQKVLKIILGTWIQSAGALGKVYFQGWEQTSFFQFQNKLISSLISHLAKYSHIWCVQHMRWRTDQRVFFGRFVLR